MARALALHGIIKEQCLAAFPVPEPRRLTAPRRFCGEFWGHKNVLEKDYAVLGITRNSLTWRDNPFFLLE
jgi:hypothetical protein